MINSFKCICPIGFTGARCQTNIDDCLSQPCRHGGICHDAIAGYSCECPPGYTGKILFLSLNKFDTNNSRQQDYHVKPISTIVCQIPVIVEFASMETTVSLVNVILDTLVTYVRHKSTNVNLILVNMEDIVKI